MPADPNQPQPDQAQPGQGQDTSDSGGRGAVLASGSAALPGALGGFGQAPGNIAPPNVPLLSGFKLLEGDSLIPIDRIYIAFNATLGLVQNTVQLAHFNQFTELMGVEKTFLNERASVTFRVPVSTIHSDDRPFNGLNGGTGTSTIVGDGSVIFKAIVHENPERGNIFTTGLSVSFPTAMTYYAGNAGVIVDKGDWILQPYLGSIFRRGELTFQDATGFGFPTSTAHSSYFYTSNSVAWMFFHSPCPKRFVSSMSAIAELSVVEPFTNRAQIAFVNRTADFINLSLGNSVVVRERFYWTYGIGYPLTYKARPYDTQVFTSMSVRY